MSRYDRSPSTVVVTPVDLTDAEGKALEFVRANAESEGKEIPSSVRVGWKWAVVDTPRGLYALCTEGVGPSSPISDENPLEVEFFVNGYEGDTEGRKFISMFPCCSMKLDAEELRERATGEPVKLEQWVRVFGGRLEANYDGWRRLLEKALEVTA